MANHSAPVSTTLGTYVNPAKLDATNDEVATGASAGQTGACTPYQYTSVSTGFDATVIKASAGRVYAIQGINTDNVKFAFLKLYDKATAPDPSADGSLLKWQMFLTPSESLETDSEPQWQERSISFSHGIGFANGIAFVLTQLPGTDETAVDAADVLFNLAYK